MWALGETAKNEGIALFTYPTTGYFDAFFYAMMYAAGGEDFFKKATTYSEGVWDTAEAGQSCLKPSASWRPIPRKPPWPMPITTTI